MSAPLNVLDFEPIARTRMEPSAYDYYAGGADDEFTLAANRRGFSRWSFLPRVLVGVDHVDTSTPLLGLKLRAPVALAPTAFNKLGHPDGERAAARAAAAEGTLMCCSTISSTSIEDVAAATTGPLWFQLYVYRDREVTRDLVRRAEAAGCRALMLTVDTPHLGRRERDVRNRFTLPPGVVISNLAAVCQRRRRSAGRARRASPSTSTSCSTRASRGSLSTGCARSPPCRSSSRASSRRADAALAIDHGASGIVVSNHGGRQLDGAVATIEALPHIADVVDGRVPVLLDGGIRRGTDVLKALALGASAVLIGRPYLWGLAADGEQGVRQVLTMLRDELALAMALAGCRSIAEISRALVTPSI